MLACCGGRALAQTGSLKSEAWNLAHRALPIVLVVLGLFAAVDITALLFKASIRYLAWRNAEDEYYGRNDPPRRRPRRRYR
ncbi:MAG: hypothetical protein HZB16_05450 [Armatimonadetes bacterium]|nr:hypothetical protein [Armatimonadota bacterium]